MAEFDGNFLRDRADTFFENAAELVKKNKFDIAAFNLEQAAQLYLKHYLFAKTQDFPRLHSLDALLQDVAKIHESPKSVEEFAKNNVVAINDLSEAYLTSRYLPTSFPKEKLEIMKNLVEKLKVLLSANENPD